MYTPLCLQYVDCPLSSLVFFYPWLTFSFFHCSNMHDLKIVLNKNLGIEFCNQRISFPITWLSVVARLWGHEIWIGMISLLASWTLKWSALSSVQPVAIWCPAMLKSLWSLGRARGLSTRAQAGEIMSPWDLPGFSTLMTLLSGKGTSAEVLESRKQLVETSTTLTKLLCSYGMLLFHAFSTMTAFSNIYKQSTFGPVIFFKFLNATHPVDLAY